jgi:hypothetical protein
MTEEINPSGTEGQASGESNDQGSSQKNPPTEKKVSHESYLKLLGEKKAASARLKEFEEAQKKAEEERLKKDGDWKGLIDARESEIANLRKSLEDTSSRFEKLNNRVTNGEKLSSVLTALGADVPSKYFGLIDIDEVSINPETGEIDALTAKKVAERFKLEYPEVLKKSVHSGMMGAGHGNGVSGGNTIKLSDWVKLPYDKQKAFKQSQIID